MFARQLQEALQAIPRFHYHQKKVLQVGAFDVTAGELPDEEELGEGQWDALIVTGSPESAADDKPWINDLCKFLVHTAEEHPLVRIIGVCFGHHLIARAFGGEVAKNVAGWEFGTISSALTAIGREILSYPPDTNDMRLIQLHQDHVTKVPPPFEDAEFSVLASTENTPVQGLVLRYVTEAPPLPSLAGTSAYVAFDVDDFCSKSAGPMPVRSAHILTFQAHPEFTKEIEVQQLQDMADKNLINAATASEASERTSDNRDSIHVGTILLAMLGVEPASSTENFA